MDNSYIKSVIQRILDKQFSDPERRRIVEYDNRLNFCAPCCGDSLKNKHAKRGNLYLNKLRYICFNCDKKTNFDRFCKDFNEVLDPQKKLEIIEHLNSVVDYTDFDNSISEIGLDKLFDIKDLEMVFNTKDISPIFDFKPIVKGGGIYKYLIGRGIPESLHHSIYQAKFSKGDEGGYEHVIVLLNRCRDKVVGIQVRNLKSGKRRFFVIYNWESLHNWIHGETEIDISDATLYNKISYYFNIFNVDFSQTITVFEGYLDSLFYPNSIGVVGTNTDLRLIEGNNLDIQYFFDNDPAGFKKSEQKIRSGYKVFLWKKLFQDIVNKKNHPDPEKLLWRISKVKDMNKLNELVPNAYKKLSLDDFFSGDIYDLKWIPKTEKSRTKGISHPSF